MVYNGDTDKQDIVSLIGDLTSTDTTQYPLQAITRAVNKWGKTVWSWIFDAYGGWLYDDSNNSTDFPIATTNLVASQQDYGIPLSALFVRGVDVLNTGGSWFNLRHVTEEQIREFMSDAEWLKTASQPMYYLVYGNSIRIFPEANYSQAASLRVSFARGSTTFASTDTTKTPGFASEFHEVLAVGAAYEFAARKGLPNAVDLEQQLLGRFTRSGIVPDSGYKDRIKNYYTERYAELFPPRITVRDAVREFQ